MGCAARATCDCGYEETFMIGGGMRDGATRCSFPCLCKQCHVIVAVNVLAEQPECPACGSTQVIPYDTEELVRRKGEECVAEWNMGDEPGRSLQLTDGFYFCPACDSFGLRFADGDILWDLGTTNLMMER